jgi:ABC-type Fe3+-hydroxamate transport system substrate-binding protein
MEDVEIIIVNKIIENRKSVKEANLLIDKIKSSNAPTIKLDWKDSGELTIAFVDSFLDNIRYINKIFINYNLAENLFEDVINVTGDPMEKKMIFR